MVGVNAVRCSNRQQLARREWKRSECFSVTSGVGGGGRRNREAKGGGGGMKGEKGDQSMSERARGGWGRVPTGKRGKVWEEMWG